MRLSYQVALTHYGEGLVPEITFPDSDPRYILDRDCLAFRATVDGKPVECLVTAELLLSEFGAKGMDEAEMRAAYRERKAKIQGLARSHIERGWVDPENRVFLTTRYT